MTKEQRGKYLVVSAYVLWGVLPLFWKWVLVFPAEQVLFHRILWAFVFLLLLLTSQNRLGELAAIFRHARDRRLLFISALLLGVNWLTYLIAIRN